MVVQLRPSQTFNAASDLQRLIQSVPEGQREELLDCFEWGLDKAQARYMASDRGDRNNMLARAMYVRLMALALMCAVEAIGPPN